VPHRLRDLVAVDVWFFITGFAVRRADIRAWLAARISAARRIRAVTRGVTRKAAAYRDQERGVNTPAPRPTRSACRGDGSSLLRASKAWHRARRYLPARLVRGCRAFKRTSGKGDGGVTSTRKVTRGLTLPTT